MGHDRNDKLWRVARTGCRAPMHGTAALLV